MSRLPVVGNDDDTWGTILNDYLGVEHNADGTQKQLTGDDIENTPSGSITGTDVQTAINQLDTNKADAGDLLSPDGATLEQSGSTLRIRRPVSTYIDIAEMTAPSNPSANTARLFCRDNGGKTELCVIFPSGSIMQIKIEA